MSERTPHLKLGVNIDHVATLRQARHATLLNSRNAEPDLLAAALDAEAAGADSITIHLRADRRHIQDRDVEIIREGIGTKLNLEMGNTPEILDIVLRTRPDFVCLVPESREEITTEGGLDVLGQRAALEPTIKCLQDHGIAVSLFIEPEHEQVECSADLGAEMVELHTGSFANAWGEAEVAEVARLVSAAHSANAAGLQVNAGHGINTRNLPLLFSVPHLAELNIGHHLVSRAIFVGLKVAVSEMVAAMSRYSKFQSSQ